MHAGIISAGWHHQCRLASSVRAGIISAGWHQVLPLEKTDNNDNGSDYAKFMYFI